jgi:hypothetical protein
LLFLLVALRVASLVPTESARLMRPGNSALVSAQAFLDLLLVSSLLQSLGEEPG